MFSMKRKLKNYIYDGCTKLEDTKIRWYENQVVRKLNGTM